MGRYRAQRYERWIGGKCFVHHSDHTGDEGKERAKKEAARLRAGKGKDRFGTDGKHFARVVSMDFHPWPEGILRESFAKWAVYTFPMDCTCRPPYDATEPGCPQHEDWS